MNRRLIADYFSMTKPRIVSMALITMVMGYWSAQGLDGSTFVLAAALLGAGLIASGASVLNHYVERDADARMDRTRARPLPAGRVKPIHALTFGLYLVLCGLGITLWQVNLLTTFLLLLSCFLYVLVYTPMKKLTVWNTSFGAIPGAIPPLAGWTAATNEPGLGGLILFLILFVWQHPHFYAIAWMHRDDYRQAGFKMLSLNDTTGARTAFWILITAVALIPVSIAPCLAGMTGSTYLYSALAAGAALLIASVAMSRHRSDQHARRVLKMSVYYLPMLLIAMIVDAII